MADRQIIKTKLGSISGLEFEPKYPDKLYVDNFFTRQLSHLIAQTPSGLVFLKATSNGALNVAVIGSGLESYRVYEGYGLDSYATAQTHTFTNPDTKFSINVSVHPIYVSFYDVDETWGSDILLPIGFHQFDFVTYGVRVKNAVAGYIGAYNYFGSR